MELIYSNVLYKKPLSFYISNEEFMKFIGFKCLTLSNFIFTATDLKRLVKLEVSLNMVETVYGRILRSMRRVGLELEIEDITNALYIKRLSIIHNDVSDNYTRWINDTACSYLEISILDFCRMLNTLVFDNDVAINKKLLLWKETLIIGKWISYKEKQDKYKLSKELSYQKQKEFIHY